MATMAIMPEITGQPPVKRVKQNQTLKNHSIGSGGNILTGRITSGELYLDGISHSISIDQLSSDLIRVIQL